MKYAKYIVNKGSKVTYVNLSTGINIVENIAIPIKQDKINKCFLMLILTHLYIAT